MNATPASGGRRLNAGSATQARGLAHADALVAAGRMGEALAVLEQIARDEPGLGQAHFRMALIHEERGDLAPALAALRMALVSDPFNDAWRTVLACMLAKTGREDEALEVLARILLARPDNVAALLVRAGIYVAREDEAAALADLMLATAHAGHGSEEGRAAWAMLADLRAGTAPATGAQDEVAASPAASPAATDSVQGIDSAENQGTENNGDPVAAVDENRPGPVVLNPVIEHSPRQGAVMRFSVETVGFSDAGPFSDGADAPSSGSSPAGVLPPDTSQQAHRDTEPQKHPEPTRELTREPIHETAREPIPEQEESWPDPDRLVGQIFGGASGAPGAASPASGDGMASVIRRAPLRDHGRTLRDTGARPGGGETQPEDVGRPLALDELPPVDALEDDGPHTGGLSLRLRHVRHLWVGGAVLFMVLLAGGAGWYVFAPDGLASRGDRAAAVSPVVLPEGPLSEAAQRVRPAPRPGDDVMIESLPPAQERETAPAQSTPDAAIPSSRAIEERTESALERAARALEAVRGEAGGPGRE